MGLESAFRKISLQVLHQVFLGISLFQIYPYLHFKLPKRNCYQRFQVDKARHLVVNRDIWLRERNIHIIKERQSQQQRFAMLQFTVTPCHESSYLLKEVITGNFHGTETFKKNRSKEAQIHCATSASFLYLCALSASP